MALNRRRRIFRSATGAARRPGWPRLGALVVAIGGVATLAAAAWLYVRPTDASAPPRIPMPRNARIDVPAGALAVVDGDTLRLGRQVVRLNGIAAPARGTTCGSADCAAAAANALAAMVRGRAVACAVAGHDRLGRPMGACRADGLDLSTRLVRDGWARATDRQLRAEEDAARQARRGIWGADANL